MLINHSAQDSKNLDSYLSSLDECSSSQVAAGNITYFENYSNFLPTITDHADRAVMFSSDPNLATYNDAKISDNFQQAKLLVSLLLGYQNFSIYGNFHK